MHCCKEKKTSNNPTMQKNLKLYVLNKKYGRHWNTKKMRKSPIISIPPNQQIANYSNKKDTKNSIIKNTKHK